MTARLAGALLLLAALSGTAPSASAASIEYLYVNASEDAASGGHVGLLLGDEVFHFEHVAPGLLRLAREPFDAVLRRYAIVENRTIERARVPVSDATYARIADEFTRRYVVQRQHLADAEAFADDRRLLEAAIAIRDRGPGGGAIAIGGAGFFADELWAPPLDARFATTPLAAAPQPGEAGGAAPAEAPALARLRARVLAAHGSDAIARATARIRAELAALVPDESRAIGPITADRLEPRPPGIARRYRDQMELLAALDVLRSARPLAPGRLRVAEPTPLEGAAIALVRALAAALEEGLVRLVASTRPDRGEALLIGMARLVALDETLARGRWVFLDLWPSETSAVPDEHLLADPLLADALHERARADVRLAADELARSAVREGGFPEVAFGALEAAANRLSEVEAAVRERRGVRLALPAGPPTRRALLRGVALPAVDPGALDAALAAARAREAAHARALTRVYGYDLFRRNCVTEIFRTLDAALARAVLGREPGLAGDALARAVAVESTRRLGGYVDPDEGLNFVPAASALAVADAWTVEAVAEIPSYRRGALAAMYAREPALEVFLRESNTLTSTLYRRAPRDSLFAFFTDDAVAARPLFGAVNLLVGVGATAAGAAMLPIDGGKLLIAGVRGVLWSLPELAFWNVRKGRFADALWRPAEGPDGGALARVLDAAARDSREEVRAE